MVMTVSVLMSPFPFVLLAGYLDPSSCFYAFSSVAAVVSQKHLLERLGLWYALVEKVLDVFSS